MQKRLQVSHDARGYFGPDAPPASPLLKCAQTLSPLIRYSRGLSASLLGPLSIKTAGSDASSQEHKTAESPSRDGLGAKKKKKVEWKSTA